VEDARVGEYEEEDGSEGQVADRLIPIDETGRCARKVR
jgi:hypothetical protein